MIGTGDNPFGAAQGAVIPNSTLPAIVADLGRLLEREKRELQAGRYDQLAGFAAEKHHLLAQMSQAVQRNGGGSPDAEQGRMVAGMREMLAGNMAMLKHRIDAINELADTIERATREAESDGTYGAGNLSDWAV